MSYCVNCGVELDRSARECPLCNTPVINPNELEKIMKERGLFPAEAGKVETVKRKDMGILLTVVLAATALVCGGVNYFVFPTVSWSMAVIGVCLILWTLFIPAVIVQKIPIYVAIFLDGLAVSVFLLMLTKLTGSTGWFWHLGLPIVVLSTVEHEILVLCLRRFHKSFLAGALCITCITAVTCTGIEILVDLFRRGTVSIGWSAVVVTVCAIVAAALITILSLKRLRNWVRKRLHF